MEFAIISILALWPVRRLGWFFTKVCLYPTPNIFAGAITAIWALLIALGTTVLIQWQNPSLWIRILFGYMLGGYLSIPDNGLLRKSSILPNEEARHSIIILSSIVSYSIFCVLLSKYIMIRN